MILIGQYDSPFVRRVAIAMQLYGMPYEHRPWSVFGDADKIAAYNLNVAGYIVKETAGRDFLNLTQLVDCYWRIVEMP